MYVSSRGREIPFVRYFAKRDPVTCQQQPFYKLSHAVTILQNENGPVEFCPFSRSHSCIPAYQRLHAEILRIFLRCFYATYMEVSFCSFITFSSSHKIRPTHSITSRNSANTSSYIQKHTINPTMMETSKKKNKTYKRQLQSALQLLASIFQTTQETYQQGPIC